LTGLDLLIALALVALNGLFVATEFSLARVRPSQVAQWERDRRPGAKSVRHAIDHIDAYLAACQLGITISSLGLGVAGERAFHNLLEPLLGEETHIASIPLAGAFAFLIITLLHVVFGELAPKSLAIARTTVTALAVAPVMRVFYFATKPLVDLFNGMGNLVLKPFGIPPAREAGHDPYSEEELRQIVRESHAGGQIEEEERDFTENVLTFGDRRAREVMVPRHRVRYVMTEDTLDEVIDRIVSTGHTRLPLCEPEGGLDASVGLLNAKDLLVAQRKDVTDLRELARPLERVPESMLIDELLEGLRRKREHLALVVDEHGTVVGLITLEDILEEIVGEIEDEFDAEAVEPITRHEDGTLLIAGWAPIRMVAERLGFQLHDAHEATIGGVILEQLGRPPEPGEVVTVEGLRFEVAKASGASVEELRLLDEAPAERTSST
jgi:CBS domain containing-hemolysin-like protein